MTRFYRFLYVPLAPLARLIFRIRVVGKDNVPSSGGYIVAANHISAADPILISAAFPEQIIYMAKKEVFRIPVLASIVKALGAYPVSRGGADVSAIKASIKMLEEGKCLGIFPQGTRHKGEALKEEQCKQGCAMIAVRAGVPVIPVAIVTKNHRFRFFRRNRIVIGKPLTPEELAYSPEATGEYQRIARRIGGEIISLGGEETV